MASDSGEEKQKWISVGGTVLNLDSQAASYGKRQFHSGFQRCLCVSGQCVPVGSFEKLNRLGEGSEWTKMPWPFLLC